MNQDVGIALFDDDKNNAAFSFIVWPDIYRPNFACWHGVDKKTGMRSVSGPPIGIKMAIEYYNKLKHTI